MHELCVKFHSDLCVIWTLALPCPALFDMSIKLFKKEKFRETRCTSCAVWFPRCVELLVWPLWTLIHLPDATRVFFFLLLYGLSAKLFAFRKYDNDFESDGVNTIRQSHFWDDVRNVATVDLKTREQSKDTNGKEIHY